MATVLTAGCTGKRSQTAKESDRQPQLADPSATAPGAPAVLADPSATASDTPAVLADTLVCGASAFTSCSSNTK